MINLNNLRKNYGQVQAIKQLNLSISKGDIFGLLGPNGAGKTSLIKLITGQMSPSEGKVTLFDGESPYSEKTRKKIGVMPQDLSIYRELSLTENLKFFGSLYGLKEDLKRRIEEVISLVELSSKRDGPIEFLSGGMQRRASLACALIHSPPLLILDEPTAGVDPLLRLKFWELFKKLAQEGTTLLITTHHISEAINCNNVAFLREGEVIQKGKPSSIIEHFKASHLEEAFALATTQGTSS